MYIMAIMVDNTVLYNWHLLLEQNFSVSIHKRKICEVMDVLNNLTVGILSQNIPNHHTVHSKYIYNSINYNLIKLRGDRERET